MDIQKGKERRNKRGARSKKQEARSTLEPILQSMRRDVRYYLIRQHPQSCSISKQEGKGLGSWGTGVAKATTK
jgi:hypothetical protein